MKQGSIEALTWHLGEAGIGRFTCIDHLPDFINIMEHRVTQDRVRILLESFNTTLNVIPRHQIIVSNPYDVLSRCKLKRPVPVPRQATIHVPAEVPHTRILGCNLQAYVLSKIGRSVICNDEFNSGKGLVKDGSDRLVDVPVPVIHWQTNTYQGAVLPPGRPVNRIRLLLHMANPDLVPTSTGTPTSPRDNH